MLEKNDVLKERYAITRLLGQGGTAKTFLAIDTTTKKEVVLKVINLGDIDDWKIIDLFERETKVLKTIDHPFIPDYIDNFREEMNAQSLYVLVQEYVDGDNLEGLIKNGKRFSSDEIKNIFKSLLKILIYIHNLHPTVIHRDINPKNIIINKEGHIYLVDFGAVGHIIKDTIEASHSDTFVGTVGYMAHEQFFGKALPASDLYALGMTIVYLLTGIEPYKMELDGMSINLDAYSVIPDNLKALLRKIIEPDYKKRLQNAQKALDFLEGKEQLPDSPPAHETLDYLIGRVQLRDLLSELFKPYRNRLKIKELCSKEKLIILPKVNSLSSAFLFSGGTFIIISIFLFVVLFSIGYLFYKYVFFLPVIFGILGILFLFMGRMLLKKRGIHLTEEKISVVKARAGSSKKVWELLLKEYKGLKIKESWIMTIMTFSMDPRTFKLILVNGKKIKLGSYSTKEIELLQDTIANHIQENASL